VWSGHFGVSATCVTQIAITMPPASVILNSGGGLTIKYHLIIRVGRPTRTVAYCKPHVTTPGAQLNDAKDKAGKRADKAKANVDRVVKKVKQAAEKTAKKLSPKKSDPDD
ncbi:hypothetical protein, partial [Streptomyces edwardsiae]